MAQATFTYSNVWQERFDFVNEVYPDLEHPRIINEYGVLQPRATLLIGRALLALLNDLESIDDIRYREPSDISDIQYIMLRFFPEYNDIDIAIAQQKLDNTYNQKMAKVIEGLAEMSKMDGIE